MEKEVRPFDLKITKTELDRFREKTFSAMSSKEDFAVETREDIKRDQPKLLKLYDEVAIRSPSETNFRYGFSLAFNMMPEDQRSNEFKEEELEIFGKTVTVLDSINEAPSEKIKEVFRELGEVDEKINNNSPDLKKWIESMENTINIRNRDIPTAASSFHYGFLFGIYPFYKRGKTIEIANLDRLVRTNITPENKEDQRFKITKEVISETIKNDSETPENKKPYSIKMLEELEEKHSDFSQLLINKCNELSLDLMSFEKAMGLVYSMIPENYRNSPLTEDEIEKMFYILSDHFDSGIDEEKEQFSWQIDFSWINEKLDADSPEFSKWLIKESEKFEDQLLGLSFITGGWLTLMPFYQRAEERKKNNNFSPPNNP